MIIALMMGRAKGLTFWATFLLLPNILLLGCGGEDNQASSYISEGEEELQTEIVEIQTQDSIDVFPEDEYVEVDLTPHIKVEGGTNLELSSVMTLSSYNNCTLTGVRGLTFAVKTSVPQVCRFEYKVNSSEAGVKGSSTGVSQLVISDDYTGVEKPLPPLSKMVTESQTILIDLSETLPDGFVVDEDSVELIGNIEDLGEASVSDNSIRYIAPSDTSGVVQIFYTAVNEATQQLLPGSIHVAISLGGNSAPIAELEPPMEDRVLTDSPDGSFNFDVSQYISDVDGDKLQLIDVYTHGLGFAKVLPLSMEFNYTPNMSGEHYLTYVVTDHKGGYGVGTLVFDVLSYRSIYSKAQTVTFSPTFTQSEISSMNGAYSALYWENGTQGAPGYHPVFDQELAQAYCVTRGKVLPSRIQLRELYTDELGAESVFLSSYQWPAGSPYIASDGWVSLATGEHGSTNEEGYISCVDVKAAPTEYSFNEEIVPAKWGGETIIVASTMSETGELFPLPLEEYELEATVMNTLPVAMESKVLVSIVDNKLTITSENAEVKSAEILVTDPSVQGELSEVSITVGLAQCNPDLDFETMQRLGCVPVVYFDETPSAFTAALSDDAMKAIGFNPNELLSQFSKTNTTPDYTYYDSHVWPSLSFDTVDQGQLLCDIFNENLIGARQNWQVREAYSPVPSGTRYPYSGTVASKVTEWMSLHTGFNTQNIGQGFLATHEGTLIQHNQYGGENDGVYRGDGGTNSSTQWQFISCYSPQ